MVRYIKFLVIVMISFFFGFEIFAADPNLLVEFTYRGKKFSVQGEKIKHGTVFNQGADKKIWITTSDWAPYIGRDVCKQGWVQQFAVALFVSQGYEVKSTFFPWARSVKMVEKGQADILYPRWYTESTAPSRVTKGEKIWDHMVNSDRFPGGPVAFMKRKGESDRYKGNLQNLKGESIVVVRGYQHTPEFDSLMDQRFFNIDIVTNDLVQAKVLWGKRVNLLINDPFVVRYTVANSDLPVMEKKEILDTLEIVQPIIQYNYLHFALSKNRPAWELTLDMVNKTIQEFESKGIVFNIIKDTLNHCNLKMDEIFSPYKNAHP